MKTLTPLFTLCLGVLLLAGATSCKETPKQTREFAYTIPDGCVNLMSFNIRQSGVAEKDGPDRWENRREAVLNMIDIESPSVIGIQEGRIDQVRFIEQGCPMLERIGVGRDDGAEGGEMMAIFYRADRFEALDSGTFWLSETPNEVSRGWDGACNRTLTWVLLREKATGKSFYFLNTHLDHKGKVAREQSVIQIADYVERNIPLDATVIVGGDLNASIEDPIFAPLKAILDVARDTADPTDTDGTFNGFGSAPSNIVLDHIFCRNTQEGALQTLRGDYGAPFISDHYPVAYLFRLP